MALVRERWFLIADRLTTTHVEAREHAWRVSGYAGRSAGGLFEARADGASWEREQAGIDVYLTSTAGAVAVTEPACVEHEAPCVHQFELDRRVEHHALIDGAVDAVAPGFLAVLAPYRVDATDEDGPLVVEEVDLGEGLAAWRVVTGGEVDLAVLRAPDAPTELSVDGHTLRTDAELVVVGLAGDYALLARGTELSLDGDLLASGTGEVVVVE